MTFVGKILVIVIMVFALFFLAVSVMVFTTEKNWKDEAQGLKTSITKLQTEKGTAIAALEKTKSDLESAKQEVEEQTRLLQAQLKDLEQQNATKQQLLSEQNNSLATSQQTMQASLREAEARKAETDQLRDTLSEVQQQANQFKLTQTELNDQIRILERQLATATDNNKDLRERVALLGGELRRVGLSDDVNQIKGVSNVTPPEVEGYVKRVDSRNQRVEISIGSDDGLVPGHELELYRTNPTPEYLGRIRIESTDADQAVGVVTSGGTVQGKKITEGDIVSSKIRPRS